MVNERGQWKVPSVNILHNSNPKSPRILAWQAMENHLGLSKEEVEALRIGEVNTTVHGTTVYTALTLGSKLSNVMLEQSNGYSANKYNKHQSSQMYRWMPVAEVMQTGEGNDKQMARWAIHNITKWSKKKR